MDMQSSRQPKRKGSGARNVRNSALPAERKKGHRDCQTCVQRRINCDRSAPACRKCESRQLQCPGYDTRLRWDQGIASRGKLKGKTQPVLGIISQPPTVNRGKSKDGAEAVLGNTSPGPPLSRGQDGLAPLQADDIRRFETCQSLSAQRHKPTLRQEYWLNIRDASSAMLCRLVRHYQDQVTPTLQWIDAPSNPWRAVLLPLCQSSKALRFAILGFSATHLYVTRTQRSDDMYDLPHRLRLKATESLNTQINQHLGRWCETSMPKTSSMVEIIATMLVLCHIEMLMPRSTHWTLHLRACREVWDLEHRAIQSSGSAPPFMEFFEKALADLEAFESLTSFPPEHKLADSELKQPAPRDRFWIFLAVVREVTFTERLRYSRLIQGLTNPDMDMRPWTDKISHARFLAFSHPSFILDSSQHLRVVFRMVADAHYHAGLIYSYQALAPPAKHEDLVRMFVDALFSEIQFIVRGEWRNFDHDLFWPLFIAGTESGFDTHRQATIQSYYEHLMAVTGFCCNAESLGFLQDYWAYTTLGYSDNWIQYARVRDTANRPFLVY